MLNRKLSLTISPASIFSFACVTVSVGYFLYNCYQLRLFTIDDSYITFRYAANLADGIGPTYNSALPLAEGYTSFLWMLIMTIPHLLNFGPVILAKIIGIAATLGTMGIMAVFIVRASRTEKTMSQIAAGLIVLIYALLPETAIHAVSGMETSLYGFCLTGMVYLAYLGKTGSRTALNWLPLMGLVIGLIRPEANLLAAAILIITFMGTQNREGFIKRMLFFYVLPGVSYFMWRYGYYGVLFPLPFYLKAGNSMFAGQEYVIDFLFFIITNFLLLLAFGFFEEKRTILLLCAVVIVDILYFSTVNPIMGYDFRFLYPVLPVPLVLAGLGLSFLLGSTAGLVKKSGTIPVAAIGIGTVVLIGFLLNDLPRTAPMFEHKHHYAAGLRDNHVKIGQALANLQEIDDDPVLVVTDAGAIPYYSGWFTIDAYGLNDPIIALGKQDAVSYVFSHDPDVMVLTSNDLERFTSDSILVRRLHDTALTNGMQVVSRKPFYQGDSIWVYSKSGGELTDRLIEMLSMSEY